MRKFSHIIWDWNGTLLNDTQASVNSINKMLADRDLPLLSVSQYRSIFGFPVYDFYRQAGFQVESEDWDAVSIEFHSLFLADQSLTLHNETVTLLETLRQHGFAQAVLSASKQSILDSMISDYNLNLFFKWIRGIDNLYGESKLTAGRALLAEMNVSSEKTVLIGDSLHDHEVAAELGVECVLVACGHQSRERLELSGGHVLDSLGELRGLLTV